MIHTGPDPHPLNGTRSFTLPQLNGKHVYIGISEKEQTMISSAPKALPRKLFDFFKQFMLNQDGIESFDTYNMADLCDIIFGHVTVSCVEFVATPEKKDPYRRIDQAIQLREVYPYSLVDHYLDHRTEFACIEETEQRAQLCRSLRTQTPAELSAYRSLPSALKLEAFDYYEQHLFQYSNKSERFGSHIVGRFSGTTERHFVLLFRSLHIADAESNTNAFEYPLMKNIIAKQVRRINISAAYRTDGQFFEWPLTTRILFESCTARRHLPQLVAISIYCNRDSSLIRHIQSLNSFLASHVTTLMQINGIQLLSVLPHLPHLSRITGRTDIEPETALALRETPQLVALWGIVSSAPVLQELVSSCSNVKQLALSFHEAHSEWLECLGRSAMKLHSLYLDRVEFDTPIIILARIPVIPCIRIICMSDIDVLSLVGVSKMPWLEQLEVGIGNASIPVDRVEELLNCNRLRKLRIVSFGEWHTSLRNVLHRLVHSGQLSDLGLMGWSDAEGTSFDNPVSDEDIIELICHEGSRLSSIEVENSNDLTERSVVAVLQNPYIRSVYLERLFVSDTAEEKAMDIGLIDDINTNGC